MSSSIQSVPATPAESASEPQASVPSHVSAVEIARLARRRKAQRMLRNLLIWVGAPTLAGIVYFGLLASDQYQSFATLSVPAGHGAVLREFMLSRDMLGALDAQVKFSAHYKSAHDPFAGLAPEAGSEDCYHSFLDNVDVRVEPSGMLRLKVRAFQGKEAQLFARQAIAQLEAFMAEKKLDPDARVVVISQPSYASQPTYPRRGYGMLTVAFVSLALFAIGSLLVAAAREHAQF